MSPGKRKKDTITDQGLALYENNLSDPERRAAQLAYFREFSADVERSAEYETDPLTMPVLAVGAEYSLGEFVPNQADRYAENVIGEVYEHTGHWIPEQYPESLNRQLMEFFEEE